MYYMYGGTATCLRVHQWVALIHANNVQYNGAGVNRVALIHANNVQCNGAGVSGVAVNEGSPH